MSCPTAVCWFKPDGEYDAITEDYAIVGRSSGAVKAILEYPEIDVGYEHERPRTFYDWALYGRRWFKRNPDSEGILIFSEVNGEDPDHPRYVQKVANTVPLLDEPEKATEDALQKLFDFAKEMDFIDEDIASARASSPTDFIHYIPFGPKTVDFIIELEGSETKAEALRVLSAQTYREHPRSVMLLLGLLDDMKSNHESGKRGWAIGYDFEENLLRIRSFDASIGKHPLGASWIKQLPEDEFYQAKNPKDLAADLSSIVRPQILEEDKPYALAIALLVGIWLAHHRRAFDFSEELSESLINQIKSIDADLNTKDFPEIKELDSTELNYALEQLKSMRRMLKRDEDSLRDMAVRANKDGFETSANNLAKFFEKTLKDLDHIIEDPETPWEG